MKQNIRRNVLGVGIIFFAAIIVMWPYITGAKLYIFSDAGGDSFYQTYPNYMYLARCIEAGNTNGTFNFFQGLGAVQGGITFSAVNWFCWFGTENVAFLMGIDQCIKIVLAGMFFYFFLRRKGCESWYSLALALGYAFCGHMTIRGAWASYPGEVVLVALWLWGCEVWIQTKDYRWVVITTIVFAYYRNSTYNILLYGLLGVGYIFLRLISEKKIQIKKILIVLAVIAGGITFYLAVTKLAIVHQVMTILGSSRAVNQIANTDFSASAFLPNWGAFPLILFRTIGLSILGGGTDYFGTRNFLEDPTFYCGISVLLLIPLAFYCMKAKQRVLYVLFYGMAFIYSFSDAFRTIVNGFANDTFKLSSFWIIVLLVLTVSNIKWEEIQKKKIWASGFIICTGIALEICTYRIGKSNVTNESALQLSMIFISIETVALLIIVILGDKCKNLKGAYALIALCEVVLLAYPIYNERQNGDPMLYRDDTIEAVQMIESKDSGFYRIDKQYQTISMCESLIQGYNGTKSYVGGTGIGEAVIQLYYDFNLIAGNDIRLLYSPSAYNDVNTLLGVKYILATSEVANYGYRKIDEIGNVGIYENQYAVPMGFVYHKWISREQFETLSYSQRQKVLLEAVLLDEDSAMEQISKEDISKLKKADTLIDKYEIPIVYSTEEYKFVFTPNTDDEMLAVHLHFADNEGGYAILHYQTESGDEGSMQIIDLEGAGEQIYEINVPDVNRIWIDTKATFDLIQVACIPQEIYYQRYNENMEEHASERVNIIQYEANYMRGTFTSEGDGFLCLPIVNNAWTFKIDGEEQSIISANDAFVGIYVEDGMHTIELIYPQMTQYEKYKPLIYRGVLCLIIVITGNGFMKTNRRKNR